MENLPSQLITSAIFILIFVSTLTDFLHYRDRPRCEITVLFGSLAAIIVLQSSIPITGSALPAVTQVRSLLILAQPYLLLRLVAHFRPVPRVQHLIGVSGLGLTLAALLTLSAPLPWWVTLAVALWFAYVQGYATLAFVRTARITQGVIRRRLIAVSLGAGCLFLVVLLTALSAAAPAAAVLIAPFSRLLAIGMTVGYFVGFAPPRWLRRSWQMAEMHRFLTGLAGRAAEERLRAALDEVGPTAARALGGRTALVALGDARRPELRIHVHPEVQPVLQAAGISTLTPDTAAPVLRQALQERRPLLRTAPVVADRELARLAAAFGGVRGVLVTPLVVGNRVFGLLIVLFAHSPLFSEEELTLLTEQAAQAIEASQLYRETQQRAVERQALLDISQAVAVEGDVAAVAGRFAAQLDRVLPAYNWGVLLARPEGGLDVAAAGGVGADERRGRYLPPGSGIFDRVLRTGQPEVVDDLSAAPRRYTPEARAMLAVPLRHGEVTLGVLYFLSDQASAFGPAELALAQIVASHTAVALARAQLVERLRQQNAALEDASRLKSEFLANMSHELRTPLNAIIGFSELLLDDPDGDYDKETRTVYLDTIHQSGQHLLALINDILDLSKVEAGKMDLHLESCQLAEIVAQVVLTVEPLAARKQITLVAERLEPDALLADEGKVKQILYNLLSNAIKFTPEGGRVTVDVLRLPDAMQLSVADTGIGIAPADQERIFQEFQQLDTGPDRRYEGTGLGLALTRRFVALHGGRIWVESTPGLGSCFFVTLPVRPAPPVAPAASPDSMRADHRTGPGPGPEDRPLVLVVEDDPRAANLMALYLGRGGYRTEIATDGRQALAKARALQPVAITLDILLPELDGWEVLRALKHDETTREIPVVVVSVLDNEHLGYALGAVDYFVKPVNRQALLALLGRYTFTTKVKVRPVQVLVIDDSPAALDLAAGMLEPAGFTVLRAGGGAEGIALAQRQRPDLVLLDLMMPEMSGFEVVTALRSDPATRDIPILIMTAKNLTAADKAALNGHVAAVLQKGAVAGVDLLGWLNQILPSTAARAEQVGGHDPR